MKLDKVLIFIALILLLFLILTSGYLLVKSKLEPRTDIVEQNNFLKEEKILNFDKEKEIKNPSEKDISNLIETLKNQNEKLNIE